MSGGVPLLRLFARAPVPGEAKTRLAADLGVDETAMVAAGLIRATTQLTVTHWPGEVRLAVWPDADHELFVSLAAEHNIVVESQVPGDLGEKMLASMHAGLDAGYPTAIMGCDAPHCPPEALVSAAQSLIEGKNVFGPAADGGFWIIGLAQHASGLFDGIDWEAPHTGRKTRDGAHRLGIALDASLPELFDIDTINEWRDLQRQHPDLANQILLG